MSDDEGSNNVESTPFQTEGSKMKMFSGKDVSLNIEINTNITMCQFKYQFQ